MTTATVIRQDGAAGHALPAQDELPAVRDELQGLWAMTTAQRVAAMWRVSSRCASSANGHLARLPRCRCSAANSRGSPCECPNGPNPASTLG